MTATAVPEVSGGTHFPCLDAYRGIGMIMVLLSHASFATGYTGSTLGPYLSRFELAVPMFFMLSGFLLYRPHIRATLLGRDQLGPRQFLRRRSLRIFPGYWAALFGIALVFGTGVLDDAWAWICNLFVLQQFGAREPLRITQAWSIGVELSFYILLPLFVIAVSRTLAKRGGRGPAATAALLCGGLIAIGWAFRIAVVVTSPSWEARSLNLLPMYLDFFAIGMVLAVLSALPPASDELAMARRAAAAAGEHPAICWSIAFAIFLLVAQMDPPPEPFGLNGLEYLPRQAAYCIGSAIWLAPAIFGDQRRGRLRGLLASRPMAWLGAISLSFYLWHLDIIHQAQAWTVDDWARREQAAANPSNELEALALFAGNFWVVSLVAIAVTVAVAAAVHHFIEVPFLRLKDRAPRRDPDPIPPTP